MLPEDDQHHLDQLQAATASQTLALTEAGKLALSLSSSSTPATPTRHAPLAMPLRPCD